MSDESTPQASEAAEAFVKQLNVAFKAVRLYPPTSAIPRESASAALATLRAMLREDPDIRLSVTKDGLFHEGGLVHPDQDAFVEFAREFFSRRLAEVRFHSGVLIDEIIGFLRVLDMPENELADSGGFEARLWESHVVNITVKEASTRIVEHAGKLEEVFEDDWPPAVDTIDDILADFGGGRPRDQVVLVRLVETPEALGDYLEESAQGRGTTPPATWVTNRVAALAKAVSIFEEGDRLTHLQGIADGLMELDEATLRDVLSERMLAEARHDDALAEVIQRIGLDRICEVLASGIAESDESREGLTRAFRNLLQVSDLGDAEVMGAVGAAMDHEAVAPELAKQVMAGISPSQITVTERRQRQADSPIERIVRIVDLAPVSSTAEADSDREALGAEAAEGISDGDILGALVSLIIIEQRDEQFNSLMSIVEDGLSLLVTRGEYHLAASVTDALVEASEDAARPEHHRARITGALDQLASKPNARAIAAAMRRHDPDSLEYKACRHLLGVLGHHAISPLLEVLADEPDMSSRKAIVALISEMAEEHIDELGTRLTDSRWYFVRNIVTILGSTRTQETLALLGRTLRHTDARVRRETLRAVSGIKDALSIEMLAAALEDADAQNVQLAARYLGLVGNRTAAGALEQVAAGQGRGNRDVAARVEAVEALGRLRATGSLGVLRSLTRTRAIRGRAAARELAAAAQAAIRVVEGSTGAKPAPEQGELAPEPTELAPEPTELAPEPTELTESAAPESAPEAGEQS